jgi:hypothetical protein
MKEFIPLVRENPKVVEVQSAWGNIPTILKDIIQRFNLKTDRALEFGVETGYSTSAIANYFTQVIGVDTFRGDFEAITANNPSNIEAVKVILKDFPNILLIESRYEDFIKCKSIEMDNFKMILPKYYDLIHVDIIHTYDPTFDCGEWAVKHSDCVIFHDTVTFPEVLRAVTDLSIKYNLDFWNYNEIHGLGILIK